MVISSSTPLTLRGLRHLVLSLDRIDGRNHYVDGCVPVPSIYSSARPEPDRSPICRDYACMISSFVRARPWARPQTQTPKLLIYGLFQKGRVLAQDAIRAKGDILESQLATSLEGRDESAN